MSANPATSRAGKAALAMTLVCGAVALGAGFALGVKVLTLFAIALALLTPLRPGAGLVGIALLAVLDSFARVLVFKGGLLPWNTFGYVLIVVFLALLPREAPRLRGAPALLAAALLALLLVEVLPSADRTEGIQHAFGLFAFFAFLLVVNRAAADRQAWIWAGVVAAVAGALFGLLFLASASPSEKVNKNAWAYVPLTGIAMLCPAVAVAGDRPALRRALTLLAAVDASVVYLSESRGTFLVALLLFAWVLFAGGDAPGERVRRLGGALLLAIPVALLLAVAFPEKFQGMRERMDALSDENRTLANRTSGRSELARIGWEIARTHPLGVGTGSFSSLSGAYGSREALAVFHGGRELEAHSAWVKTLAENGFPGVLLLAAFVSSFALTGIARRERGVAGLGLAASAVLAVAFLSTEFQPKGVWLFAAVVALALERGRVRRAVPAESAAPAALAPHAAA